MQSNYPIHRRDFQESIPSVKSKSCSSSVKWDPPASGMVCINVDAAVDRNGSGCNSGIVAQDHNGAALCSRGNYYMNPLSSLVAKIIAIKDGVLAKERKWNQWFIVSDCHNVVDLLSNLEVQSGELDLLADEVRKQEEAVVETDVPQEVSMVKEFARLVRCVRDCGCGPEMKWFEFSRKTQVVPDSVMRSIELGFKPIVL
ncbi:uncharacterized protein A4U43_C07F34970 [Asparagus officinalis]|uniref:RNase H type-1 domain-containing protein n=1 Tax=Asparagus officinalis TaxID=4686 RepID=A0A5P1EH46_ASPOF|nr:uncharacterized protein A4U43_C07F34970 [Asparagus officinalis]